MKVLSPAVTILLTSHMKPYLDDALESVAAQTRKDFHCVVLDSGQWIAKTDDRSMAVSGIYHKWKDHPLVEWVTTGENSGLRKKKCPIGWVTNEAIRAGLARGRYFCTFYDDDLYQPTFIEKMAGYLDQNPFVSAVWCTEGRAFMSTNDKTVAFGEIVAHGPKQAGMMDCQVDGAQVMLRRELLDKIGDPWMPEKVSDCFHSDGIFLEKVATAAGTIQNIEESLVTHRCTPLSTYNPSKG